MYRVLILISALVSLFFSSFSYADCATDDSLCLTRLATEVAKSNSNAALLTAHVSAAEHAENTPVASSLPKNSIYLNKNIFDVRPAAVENIIALSYQTCENRCKPRLESCLSSSRESQWGVCRSAYFSCLERCKSE
jgi:hypothetical protein